MALASTIKERTNLDLHNEMIRKAEDLIPVLKKRSESANIDRRIPKETIQDMKDAGFFKILQPKQYGGHELDPHTFSEVQLRIAQGCMSTAWVLGVVGIHPFQLALV
jgi:3-hydroxy-9,10-secoandrosta-1,3,5(10)-triene-9,17-dione monooxygenase